jgi:hypothetical protein
MDSPSCEFNIRETSPMPLDRRDSFRGASDVAPWFEELRKSFISLSEPMEISPRCLTIDI